jgi:hypothetical protein
LQVTDSSGSAAPAAEQLCWKKWHCGWKTPSAAEAEIDFVALTARLKAAPFQDKIRPRVFQANCEAGIDFAQSTARLKAAFQSKFKSKQDFL